MTSSDSVKVNCNVTGKKGYITLTLSYGFTVEVDGKKRYRPAKVNTGIVIDPENWSKTWFTSEFTQTNTKEFTRLAAEIQAAKTKLAAAFDELALENEDVLPTPEQVIQRYRGEESKKSTAVRLTEYIKGHIEKQRNPRTAAKFFAVLGMVEALEAIRPSARFPWSKQTGRLYVHTFSKQDWEDYGALIDHAGNEVPRNFRAKGPLGVELIKNGGGYYSITTKAKYQSDLAGILRAAQEDGIKLKINVDKLSRVSRKSDSKECLKPDELAVLINARMDNPGEENARRLFVLGCLAGLRYDDYDTIINSTIHDIKGEEINFQAIQYVQKKEGSKVCLPLFAPALDILKDHQVDPLVVRTNASLNGHIHTIAKKLGLDRPILIKTTKANGSFVSEEVPLYSVLSSHSGRRTFYTLLTKKLLCSRQLITQATGHAMEKDNSADLGYLSDSPEGAAEMLIIQAAGRAGMLPFKLFSDDVRDQLVANKAKNKL